MWKRLLHRWGWAAMRRAGVTTDLVDVFTVGASPALLRELDRERRERERQAELCRSATRVADQMRAVFAAQRIANCLVNGLRVAGPGEIQ